MTSSENPRPLPSISDLLCQKDPTGDECFPTKFPSPGSSFASTPVSGGVSSLWSSEVFKGFGPQRISSSGCSKSLSLSSPSAISHTRASTMATPSKDPFTTFFAQDVPSRRPRVSQLEANKTYSSDGFSCVPRTNPATSESDTSSSHRQAPHSAKQERSKKKVLEALLHIVSDVLSEEANDQNEDLQLGNEYGFHHVSQSSPPCTCHQHSCCESQAMSYPPARPSHSAHRRPSFAQPFSPDGLGYRVSPSFRHSPYARPVAFHQHQQQRSGHPGVPSPRFTQEQTPLQQSRLLHYLQQSMNHPSPSNSRPSNSRPSPRNLCHSSQWPAQTSASSASSPTTRPMAMPPSTNRKAARRPRSSMKVSSPKLQKIARNQESVGEASASGSSSAARDFGALKDCVPL